MTEKFLIWSHEHKQWWRPNHIGYTDKVSEAGRYTEAEAGRATVHVIPPGIEVAVSEIVAERHNARLIYGILLLHTEDTRRTW